MTKPQFLQRILKTMLSQTSIMVRFSIVSFRALVQGGGIDANMQEKPTKATIRNESSNGLKNTRGTLAMARMNHPDSASSQFFINVVDNDFLNRSPRNAGYAVFGQVIKGMDVVDKIVKVPTGNYGMHQNVPKQAVKILSVKVKEAAPTK